MSAIQMLEKYMTEHPDCWDFENEIKEVERLKALCMHEAVKTHNIRLLAQKLS